MLKKTITYKDYNGDEVTEDLYFNINETDILEIELEYNGGLEKMLNDVIAAGDGKTLFREFKKIILISYGEKANDGKLFRKTDQIRDDFQASQAFNKVLKDILTDDKEAAAFIKGIMPEGFNSDPDPEKSEELKRKIAEKFGAVKQEDVPVIEETTDPTVEDIPVEVLPMTTAEVAEQLRKDAESGSSAE